MTTTAPSKPEPYEVVPTPKEALELVQTYVVHTARHTSKYIHIHTSRSLRGYVRIHQYRAQSKTKSVQRQTDSKHAFLGQQKQKGRRPWRKNPPSTRLAGRGESKVLKKKKKKKKKKKRTGTMDMIGGAWCIVSVQRYPFPSLLR